MTFEDLHEYDGGQVYLTPNEQFLVWREILKRIPIYRAAGICSGGEVGFFSILPLVRKDLVLVDHSYRSLAVAMIKYLILRDYGWREAQRIFTSGGTALSEAIEKVRGEIPQEIVDGCSKYLNYQSHKSFDALMNSVQNAIDIRNEWAKPTNKILSKAHKKLLQVGFIHGDLTDLIGRGPFNLLYLSNALEHISRTKKHPLIEDIEKIVAPGGYVISAGNENYADDLLAKRWIKRTCVRPQYKAGEDRYLVWGYNLYQVPSKKGVTC